MANGRSGTPALKSKLSKTASLASAERTPTVGQPPNPLAARFSAGVARNNDYRLEGYPDGKITQNGAKATRNLIPATVTTRGAGGDSGWVRFQGRHWAKTRRTFN